MVKIEHNPEQNTLVCKFSGRLDTIVSGDLQKTITARLHGCRESDDETVKVREQIIFDLSEVSYIASSFIRICISTAKQALPGNFSIRKCDPFIKKTFKIAGLDEVLNIS